MSDQILASIGKMPLEFRRRGDVSMISLLEESGYLGVSTSITEEVLESYFRANPDQVDAWLLESMDQRCTPAWYLESPAGESDNWIVGYIDSNGHEGHKTSYDQASRACAAFVKNWLEQLSEDGNNAS